MTGKSSVFQPIYFLGTTGYGSYFARLKVKDVDEMDFLVVIDSNTGVFTNGGGIEYGKGLGSAQPNHKYDARFKKADMSGVSPNALLRWLQGIIWEVLEPLGGEYPEIDGPAIKVILKSKGIKFDLVPAGIFERTDGSERIFYNIPSGDGADDWTLTNPREDIARIDRIAEKCDGFRNVVRLLKLVRDSYEIPINSYAVQCAAAECAEKREWRVHHFGNFALAVVWLGARVGAGEIADGFDPSVNLLKGVSDLGVHADTLGRIADGLLALPEETDEEVAYNKLWQLLKRESRAGKKVSRSLVDLLNEIGRAELADQPRS